MSRVLLRRGVEPIEEFLGAAGGKHNAGRGKQMPSIEPGRCPFSAVMPRADDDLGYRRGSSANLVKRSQRFAMRYGTLEIECPEALHALVFRFL